MTQPSRRKVTTAPRGPSARSSGQTPRTVASRPWYSPTTGTFSASHTWGRGPSPSRRCCRRRFAVVSRT
eukprot:6473317-Pyramimonas_sp.AAC.1